MRKTLALFLSLAITMCAMTASADRVRPGFIGVRVLIDSAKIHPSLQRGVVSDPGIVGYNTFAPGQEFFPRFREFKDGSITASCLINMKPVRIDFLTVVTARGDRTFKLNVSLVARNIITKWQAGEVYFFISADKDINDSSCEKSLAPLYDDMKAEVQLVLWETLKQIDQANVADSSTLELLTAKLNAKFAQKHIPAEATELKLEPILCATALSPAPTTVAPVTLTPAEEAPRDCPRKHFTIASALSMFLGGVIGLVMFAAVVLFISRKKSE